ncbi:MAG TPA: V-type ATPase subunit [Solirubrobacterales bacterium]
MTKNRWRRRWGAAGDGEKKATSKLSYCLVEVLAAVYEYGNARLRAMRSRLLDRSTLESLVARRDLGHLASTLEAGAYTSDFESARAEVGDLAQDPVAAIDLALRHHLARTGRGVLSYYDGRARDLVGLLLGRRDLENLLAAIRGRTATAEAPDVSRLFVLGGELSADWLAEIVRSGQVEGLRLVGDWLCVPAQGLVSADDARRGEVEAAVVRAFYARALGLLVGGGADVSTVRQVLGWRVDVLNLTTALRVCRLPARERPADPRGLLVEGGSLSRRSVESIGRAPDVEAAAGEIAATPYRESVDEASRYLARVGRAAALECALERLLVRRAARLYRADPLGIGVVVGYLAAQSVEVANLRLIARCLALGLDKRDIFDQIWLPES